MQYPFEHKEANAIRATSPDAIKFDDTSFENFFKEYFQPLCVYCQYKFDFDLDLAKDAVHAGFIKFWENRHVILNDLSPKAYLYKIVTNICYDIMRQYKVKQKYEKFMLQFISENYIANDYDSVDFKQLSCDIDEALAELPEQMRKIFELSRYEGLKYAEIANHLNISIKTVETHMSRALIKLRQKLADYLTLYFIVFCFLP